VLALLPLLRWCCRCLRHGLPRRPQLSTCQLNEGENACKVTAQRKHNEGKEACRARALMPAHQGWQRQCDKGKNDTSTMAQTCQLDRGNNANCYRWQQWPHCYKGNNTSLMTMLAWLWQRCNHDEGHNHHSHVNKDTCASMATMPSRQGQLRHRNDIKEACTSMMTMTPLQQGQWCQLKDSNNAIAMRATTPLRIKGDGAIQGLRCPWGCHWSQTGSHIHIRHIQND
jgi:hypothetical protein